jgi:hypothetical protein
MDPDRKSRSTQKGEAVTEGELRWQWDQQENGESWFIHSEADGLTIYVDPIPCKKYRLRAISRQDAKEVTFSNWYLDLTAAKKKAELLMEVAIEEFADKK